MEIKINDQIVSDDYEPFIIAEAGVHHYNSLELAKEYILQAKIAGADAIKFQTYKAKRIAAKWAPTYWDTDNDKTQFDIFSERSLLKKKDYAQLVKFAKNVGIIFLSTPFDPDSADMLNEMGMGAYKIASADLTYYPLLEHISAFRKPIILSTGAAEFSEIDDAVSFLRKKKADIALLHCVLSYPTLIKNANLKRITALKDRYPNLVIGYSDHTQPQDSILPCALAVGLGARIIEKHFTLNKLLDGDDHYHAVDTDGLSRLVRECKNAHLMTSQMVELENSERAARTNARRSIVAARPIKKGKRIEISDLDFKRPGTGLSPKDLSKVLNKKAKKNITTDDLITLDILL